MTDLSPIQPPQRKPTPQRPVARKKNKPKAAKKSGSGPALAVVGGVILISLFMVFRSRTTPVELPAKIEHSDAPRIIESNKQLKQMQAQGQQRTALLIAERAAGLRTLPTRNQKGHPPTLQIQVKSFARGCTVGDLDIIKRDQEWSTDQNQSLVLSLEELGPSSSRKPIQKAVTIEQLQQNFSTEFVVDGIRERSMMGLFLCSAHKGESCQQQTRPNLAELSQLQGQIKSGAKQQIEYPTAGKVFFFHFLVAYPDRLLLHDSGQTLESSQSRLQAALEKGGGNVSPAQLSDVMERMRSAGSLPGIIMSDYLQIQLPRRGDKCL